MYFQKKILRSWINPSFLNINHLQINENAIDYFKENPDKINWSVFQYTKNADHL